MKGREKAAKAQNKVGGKGGGGGSAAFHGIPNIGHLQLKRKLRRQQNIPHRDELAYLGTRPRARSRASMCSTGLGRGVEESLLGNPRSQVPDLSKLLIATSAADGIGGRHS
eukprot:1157775-Pelagomonas_calceolata.AAC.5